MNPAADELGADKLADDQLAAFDRDMMVKDRWRRVLAAIERDFPDGQFSFVDVGGGNGSFADRLLAHYPNARGTVLDASELLLSKNVPSDRKAVVCADALDLQKHCRNVDIVFCNWLLHHLVATGSYRATRSNITAVLGAAAAALSARGRLSVYEHLYNGFVHNMPGRIIFEITSLKVFAPLSRRLGANTAGVGVSFLSHREWLRVFHALGLHVHDTWIEPKWGNPPWQVKLQLLALGVRSRLCGHYWIGRGAHLCL